MQRNFIADCALFDFITFYLRILVTCSVEKSQQLQKKKHTHTLTHPRDHCGMQLTFAIDRAFCT